nr:MAG TPA: hypothetical protein [Caudoviricetes sp.]
MEARSFSSSFVNSLKYVLLPSKCSKNLLVLLALVISITPLTSFRLKSTFLRDIIYTSSVERNGLICTFQKLSTYS